MHDAVCRYSWLMAEKDHFTCKNQYPLKALCAGGMEQTRFAFLDILQSIQGVAQRPDVVLGQDTEAPPLPSAACMRLNLLDIVANVQAIAVKGVFASKISVMCIEEFNGVIRDAIHDAISESIMCACLKPSFPCLNYVPQLRNPGNGTRRVEQWTRNCNGQQHRHPGPLAGVLL